MPYRPPPSQRLESFVGPLPPVLEHARALRVILGGLVVLVMRALARHPRRAGMVVYLSRWLIRAGAISRASPSGPPPGGCRLRASRARASGRRGAPIGVCRSIGRCVCPPNSAGCSTICGMRPRSSPRRSRICWPSPPWRSCWPPRRGRPAPCGRSVGCWGFSRRHCRLCRCGRASRDRPSRGRRQPPSQLRRASARPSATIGAAFHGRAPRRAGGRSSAIPPRRRSGLPTSN